MFLYSVLWHLLMFGRMLEIWGLEEQVCNRVLMEVLLAHCLFGPLSFWPFVFLAFWPFRPFWPFSTFAFRALCLLTYLYIGILTSWPIDLLAYRPIGLLTYWPIDQLAY